MFLSLICNTCYYAQYVLDMDNMSSNRKFDVEKAASMFKSYVRKEDNLVRAKLVSSIFKVFKKLYFFFTVYVLFVSDMCT